jgi:hypothetical protein
LSHPALKHRVERAKPRRGFALSSAGLQTRVWGRYGNK